MATETQKNYKKQMRELQKELNNNSDTGFYSYIERDYIKSYYQKRKRKRLVKPCPLFIEPLTYRGRSTGK